MENRVFGLAFVEDGEIDVLGAFLPGVGLRPVEPAASWNP